MKIYVGNLSFDITEEELRKEFQAYGQVGTVEIIKDKFTGKPKGFGFIEMPTISEAQAAIAALNGKMLKERALTVNAARPREERSDRGGQGRGGGGGYGGRGGSGGRGGDRGGYGGGRQNRY
jgi:RNA recognition motif-containing protein